ncbi:MAG: hypothetical protein NTX91_01465 [candidate division SR1 bacterium]|nr:hypothetical protein [candidate division SR1 bacterium]
MTIKNNGKIGIGTISPTQALTVSGNINVTSGHGIYDGSGNPYITSASLGGYLTSETDPIFAASDAAAVTSTKISNWDTAYARGNHATQGYLKSSDLVGYLTASALTPYILQSQTGNWNTAFSRGNHRTMGYLTGYTETDPLWSAASVNYYNKTQVDSIVGGIRAGMVYQGLRDYSTGALPANVEKGDLYEISVTGTGHNGLDLYIRDIIIANKHVTGSTVGADWTVIIMDANPNIDPIFTASPAFNITSLGISHWNTAYSRGDHRTMGYLTGEIDPEWNAAKTNYYTTSQIDTMMNGLAGGLVYIGGRDYSTGALPSNVHKGDMYIISSSPSNPDFDFHIESPDEIIAKRDVVGATTSGDWEVVEMDMEEQDPIFSASAVSGITSLIINNRNTAYSRGNHRSMGYLTGESDPVFLASDAAAVTSTKISHWDTAYGRGDWHLQGFLTSASLAGYATTSALSSYVLQSQTGNRNTAYSRGNHRTMGYLTGENDSVFLASDAAAVTSTKISHWDTAYGRGNHATMGYLTGGSLTDYVTTSSLSSYVLKSQTGNWNTAYSRGNHRTMGYLTGETDPVFAASAAYGITPTNISNWTAAYSRGDWHAAGFLTSYTETDPIRNAAKTNYYTKTEINNKGYLTGENDPVFLASTAYGIASLDVTHRNTDYNRYLTNSGRAMYFWNNSGNYYTKSQVDALGYLTGESDPVFLASTAHGISAGNVSNGGSLVGYLTGGSMSAYVLKSQTGNWNTAYGRGNHRTMGYLTGESDPVFLASAAYDISSTNISNWNMVYSRGDRRSQGFLTSYTETDPIWSAASTNYYTKTEINNKGYLTGSALVGYLTGGSLASYVPMSATGNWNTAYGRGDHRTMGYLTGGSFANYVQLSQTGNWNTAYSRGNHASAGYLTASALTPYILSSLSGNWNIAFNRMNTNSGNALYFRNNSGSYYTKNEIDAKGYLTGGSAGLGLGYTLDVMSIVASTLTDGQTLYIGQLPLAPTTTVGIRKVYIRHGGTIKMANIYSYAGTAGTNEAWSGFIRLNNTTDYLIQTLNVSATERVRSNTGMNIPVVAGDYIEIKLVAPTRATNPATATFGGYLYIE